MTFAIKRDFKQHFCFAVLKIPYSILRRSGMLAKVRLRTGEESGRSWPKIILHITHYCTEYMETE